MQTPEIPTARALPRACIFAILALLLGQSAPGQTFVCGLVENQHWTSNGSPYIVTCDVQVDSLTIGPGVEVRFQSNYAFQVTGLLLATGSAAQPILFTTTNVAVGWQGVFFNQVLPLSELNYCIFEFAQNSGVRILNSIVAVEQCIFRNNTALQGGGINISNLEPGLGVLRISSCSFSNNIALDSGGAVRADVTGNSVKFACCMITANRANPSRVGNVSRVGGGIYLTGNGIFENCQITANDVQASANTGASRSSNGGGAFLDGNATIVFRNCTVSSNTAWGGQPNFNSQVFGRGGGIHLANGIITVVNSMMLGNTSLNEANGGSGFYLSGAGSLLNCTIVNNNNGGLRAPGNTTEIRNSIIYNNVSSQVTGTTNIWFSCVQNGNTANGNITSNPSINAGCPSLRITFSSPCKDAGDPDSAHNDVCLDDVNSCRPISRGTARNDMGAHGGPGACLWENTCSECTLFVSGPASIATCYGQNATFCVTAAGCEPFAYQWRFNDVTIPDATNNCFTVTNVQAITGGVYSVVVRDAANNTKTNSATLVAYPACIDIHLYAGLTISGQTGQVYCVQYVTDLNSTNWTSLTNFAYTGQDFFYLDRQSPFQPKRFYRVVEGPCPP